MAEAIDHISINDIFWVQFREHLISFGFKGLPKDTHFTISFDKKSADINFHITKNVADPTNKPKITIVCVDKLILEEITPSLFLSVVNKILQPINIEELKSNSDSDLGFISFDGLENSDTSLLTEQKLIESFREISRLRKKTRLKIDGDIEKRFESFVTSDELKTSVHNKIVEFPTEFKNLIDGGIIISEENTIQVFRIGEKWFTLKMDLNPLDLLTAFINLNLSKKLIWKTKRALVSIKNAATYTDIMHLNEPIRLVQPKAKNENGTAEKL